MSETKADMLFLERDCPHCGVIKALLNIEAVSSDDFRGTEGQELFVFAAQSNRASLEMLKRVGLAGRNIPVLLTHDGMVLTTTKDIVRHLTAQGMTT